MGALRPYPSLFLPNLLRPNLLRPKRWVQFTKFTQDSPLALFAQSLHESDPHDPKYGFSLPEMCGTVQVQFLQPSLVSFDLPDPKYNVSLAKRRLLVQLEFFHSICRQPKENLVMGISSTATEYVVNQPSTVFLLLFRIRFLRCT